MSTRFLSWYLGGLLGLISLLLSLITVVPSVEAERTIAQILCTVFAVIFVALGLSCGLLSDQHWINRSGVFRGIFLPLAIALTLFVCVGVIG